MSRVSRPAKVVKESQLEKKRVQSEFPKDTLEQSLRVAQALEEANGGQPLPPVETATALGISPGSSDFRALLSSSFKYGLTSGSYKSERIELTDLGRQIVEPKSTEESREGLVAAALAPPTFRNIYEYYKGKKIPEKAFFQNTIVREFGVPREHAGICVDTFTENVDAAGLVRATKSGPWLSIEAAPPKVNESSDDEEEHPQETADVVSDFVGPGRSAIAPDRHNGAVVKVDPRERRVFVTHGTDKSFVEPIKKLLGFGEMVPVVAVERQSVSKPVPDKVMDDMRSCGAAIIHVDAEQTLMDSEANAHVVLNPNVLIEIGGAMALYGRRFVLLVRDGVKLPSNLQGLYEVRYQGGTLDGDATIRLLEAINDIKKHPLPVQG